MVCQPPPGESYSNYFNFRALTTGQSSSLLNTLTPILSIVSGDLFQTITSFTPVRDTIVGEFMEMAAPARHPLIVLIALQKSNLAYASLFEKSLGSLSATMDKILQKIYDLCSSRREWFYDASRVELKKSTSNSVLRKPPNKITSSQNEGPLLLCLPEIAKYFFTNIQSSKRLLVREAVASDIERFAQNLKQSHNYRLHWKDWFIIDCKAVRQHFSSNIHYGSETSNLSNGFVWEFWSSESTKQYQEYVTYIMIGLIGLGVYIIGQASIIELLGPEDKKRSSESLVPSNNVLPSGQQDESSPAHEDSEFELFQVIFGMELPVVLLFISWPSLDSSRITCV
ncbi:hypothetical protein AOL_s00091g6 [Orbilia oligospora ATCC 24927]|uniref:Uncharacterized protein n=1 Tax=Arthrobotrys oligospora (strain ATCC 24927 / CBS 115.81 / DSM 1491) TaxID=756982 RepID=G1XHV4_ARTOA|nr:hypothetical protein AOL_s00091g6 [Orbilia oligospora ATCC 24927]EGX47262.1 hypothetical protein AOL_s00091g6 [Orbilia oligospora ATCC 24927]